MGIKGVLWDGTVADGLAFVFEFALIFAEVKKINYLAQEKVKNAIFQNLIMVFSVLNCLKHISMI